MKNKIIGPIVCMLMLSPVFGSAMPVQSSWYPEGSDYFLSYPTAIPFLITIQIVATITNVTDPHDLLGGMIHVNDTLTSSSEGRQ